MGHITYPRTEGSGKNEKRAQEVIQLIENIFIIFNMEDLETIISLAALINWDKLDPEMRSKLLKLLYNDLYERIIKKAKDLIKYKGLNKIETLEFKALNRINELLDSISSIDEIVSSNIELNKNKWNKSYLEHINNLVPISLMVVNATIEGKVHTKENLQDSLDKDVKVFEVDYNKSLIRDTRENDIVNNLEGNALYKLSNGTEFSTNEQGHVEEISFKPDFDNKVKRDSRQTAVGKEGFDDDVGGHIQACIMGGSCDRYNLFPQNANFNNSAYKIYFENILRRANKDGKTLGYVKIKFNRNDLNSLRPDGLKVAYEIDGVEVTMDFKNQYGGGIR